MKQEEHGWRVKLDRWALEFLEGYRKTVELRTSLKNDDELRQRMAQVTTDHPQLRMLGEVDLLPEFLNLIMQHEDLSKPLAGLSPKPGPVELPSTIARFVDTMQTAALVLEKPEGRILASAFTGFVTMTLGGLYEDTSKRYFGEAGPKDSKQFMWLLGTVFEVFGKSLKKGKPTDLKGKVNVELVQLIKTIREHEVKKLTYRELRNVLAYAGVHVTDEETLRVFEWRARKKGWLRSPKREP